MCSYDNVEHSKRDTVLLVIQSMRHLHHDDDDSGGSPTRLSSWTAYKNQGKQRYERGQFQGALQSYNSALHPDLASSMPAMERQIILSNMVACRLKIGGRAQAEAAVENAKQVCPAIVFFSFLRCLGPSTLYVLIYLYDRFALVHCS